MILLKIKISLTISLLHTSKGIRNFRNKILFHLLPHNSTKQIIRGFIFNFFLIFLIHNHPFLQNLLPLLNLLLKFLYNSRNLFIITPNPQTWVDYANNIRLIQIIIILQENTRLEIRKLFLLGISEFICICKFTPNGSGNLSMDSRESWTFLPFFFLCWAGSCYFRIDNAIIIFRI